MSSKRILAILLGAFVLGLFIVGIGCGVTIQEFKDIKTEPLKENYLFNSVTMNVPEKNSDIYIDFSDIKSKKTILLKTIHLYLMLKAMAIQRLYQL